MLCAWLLENGAQNFSLIPSFSPNLSANHNPSNNRDSPSLSIEPNREKKDCTDKHTENLQKGHVHQTKKRVERTNRQVNSLLIYFFLAIAQRGEEVDN